MRPIERNPFIIGGYVSPYYFCDRETESSELLTAILNHRNTAIISLRRMGKTGLIQHHFHFRRQPAPHDAEYIFLAVKAVLSKCVIDPSRSHPIKRIPEVHYPANEKWR